MKILKSYFVLLCFSILLHLPVQSQIAIDYSLSRIVSPESGCSLGLELIELEVQASELAGYTFSIEIQVDGGAPLSNFYSIPPVVVSSTTIPITFPIPADFSSPGQHTIVATVIGPGDPDPSNNSLSKTVTNGSPVSGPLREFFEFQPVGSAALDDTTLGKWLFNSGKDQLDWYTWHDFSPSLAGSPAAGPSEGNYLYLNPSGGSASDKGVLKTLCYSVGLNEQLSFAYHMYGIGSGSLSVSAVDGAGAAINLFSVSGDQHSAPMDPWEYTSLDLSAFAGIDLQLQFSGSIDPASIGFIGLGDISIGPMPLPSDTCGLIVNHNFETSFFTTQIPGQVCQFYPTASLPFWNRSHGTPSPMQLYGSRAMRLQSSDGTGEGLYCSQNFSPNYEYQISFTYEGMIDEGTFTVSLTNGLTPSSNNTDCHESTPSVSNEQVLLTQTIQPYGLSYVFCFIPNQEYDQLWFKVETGSGEISKVAIDNICVVEKRCIGIIANGDFQDDLTPAGCYLASPPSFPSGCLPNWENSHGTPNASTGPAGTGDRAIFMWSQGATYEEGIYTNIPLSTSNYYTLCLDVQTAGSSAVGDIIIASSSGLTPYAGGFLGSARPTSTILAQEVSADHPDWTTVTFSFWGNGDSQLMIHPCRTSASGQFNLRIDNVCLKIDSTVLCTPGFELDTAWHDHLAAGVLLNWTTVPGSVGCQVKGGETTFDRSVVVLGAEANSHFIPYAMLDGTASIKWKVRCACSTSPLILTDFSPTDTIILPTAKLINEQASVSQSPNALSIFPNPAQGNMTVELPLGIETNAVFELRIYDLSGRLLIEKTAEASHISFDADKLTPGTYLLQLNVGNELKHSRFTVN